MHELKWVSGNAETGRVARPPVLGVRPRGWATAMTMAAGLFAGAIIATVFGPFGSSRRAPDVVRLLTGVQPASALATGGRTGMAFSPDGKSLVFSAFGNSRRQLYLRTLDRLETTPIAGTEDGDSPFFSPDGRWVGFWSGVNVETVGDLKKVPLGGGPAVTVWKTPALFGASWGSNDMVVFANVNGGLMVVAAGGGMPQRLTTLDAKKGEISHRLPHVLPNGRGVLFTVLKASRRWDDAEIIVRSLVTSEQRVLVTGGADARYVPTGHVLYARMGTLMALPFDLARLQATGGPYGVVEGVAQSVNAACDDVPLTSEMRTALRERYDDCLCPACLRTAGESRATSSFPPASLPSTSSSAA